MILLDLGVVQVISSDVWEMKMTNDLVKYDIKSCSIEPANLFVTAN